MAADSQHLEIQARRSGVLSKDRMAFLRQPKELTQCKMATLCGYVPVEEVDELHCRRRGHVCGSSRSGGY